MANLRAARSIEFILVSLWLVCAVALYVVTLEHLFQKNVDPKPGVVLAIINYICYHVVNRHWVAKARHTESQHDVSICALSVRLANRDFIEVMSTLRGGP